MKPRTLKIIAFMLVVMAVVLAVAGYRLSQQQPPQQAAVGELPYKVVVAASDIAPNEPIKARDVELAPYPVATTGTFSDMNEVIGKEPFTLVRKGQMLTADHFSGGSILAGQISPDYRAMAVTVDETIGTGGFLQPGDRVDVVYSSRANRETNNRSLARRVLTNVKVLAFGATVKGFEAEDDRSGGSSGKRSRTAVLEIRETDVSKLLLAENTGVLRLVAVGQGDLGSGLAADADDENAVTMPDLTGWKGKGAANPRPSVYVYHGDDVQTVRTTP